MPVVVTINMLALLQTVGEKLLRYIRNVCKKYHNLNIYRSVRDNYGKKDNATSELYDFREDPL